MQARPLPLADSESRPYWEGARRHELVVLRCPECAYYVHYPQEQCPRCGTGKLVPSRVSGRGVVHSYTITHHRAAPGFEDRVPFVVALVELEEQRGLRIVSNLSGCRSDEVQIGMSVEVVFEDVAAGVSLPQFRPRHQARD